MDSHANDRRIEWIDFCKFIAIFYMVWGHSGTQIMLDKYIHVFHMPIFFFLSGYLFDATRVKNFKELLIKKIRTLLVPYFLFPIVIFYFWTIAYGIIGKSNPETQVSLWKGIFTVNPIISPYGAVQWFLTCLFLVEIIFYVMIKTIKHNQILLSSMLILLSLMGYFYTSVLHFRLYWGLDIALTALVFYGLGYLFRNTKYTQIKSFVLSPSIFKIIMFLILSIIFSFSNGYVNMRTLQYGNYFLYYLSSLTSIIMYLMVAIYICKIKIFNSSKLQKFLLYIGQNTLIVLVLNQFFLQSLRHVENHIPTLDGSIRDIIRAVIVISLMGPTAYLINKYVPLAVGRKNNKSRT